MFFKKYARETKSSIRDKKSSREYVRSSCNCFISSYFLFFFEIFANTQFRGIRGNKAIFDILVKMADDKTNGTCNVKY
jgi:hypothetical protein